MGSGCVFRKWIGFYFVGWGLVGRGSVRKRRIRMMFYIRYLYRNVLYVWSRFIKMESGLGGDFFVFFF